MASETVQELILGELKKITALLTQIAAQKPAPAAPGMQGTADDPVIPFGRSKGKRMSEVDAREWEFFAALPVRTDKEGKPYPATLQNAALRLLGRPPLSSKHQDDAPDEPKQRKPDPDDEWARSTGKAPDANVKVDDDSIPF